MISGPYRDRFSSMGCPCETVLYARSRLEARDGFRRVRREVQRLDRKYSHYDPESGLARLVGRATRCGGAAVDGETAALLDYADRQYQVSGGRFDVTARPLTRLWDRADRVPEARAIRRAQACTGWERVEWSGRRLTLPAGFELDLGGVVKEYAADRSALLLRRSGFHHGYVELGGDFHVIGPHPSGAPWRIGIRDPVCTERSAAAVEVRVGGLASSGDYERFSQVNGVRYSHFIDPRSGMALVADPERSAVSVLAPSCLLAGSVATLAMLLRGRTGDSFLAGSGLPWVSIGTQVTSSLSGRLAA